MKLFGFFRGMIYGDDCDENFDTFKNYVNDLPRDEVIKHIEGLDGAYACITTYDIFTGEMLPAAGIYDDGEFRFPFDFLHYYRNYNIGLPPEYEEYLKKKLSIGDDCK